MSKKILEIWNNKSSIFEGIKNSIFKKEQIEQIANARIIICESCPNIDRIGTSCVVPGSAPCCKLCGCKLGWKTRSLSEGCDDNRWNAIITEEENDQVKKDLNIED